MRQFYNAESPPLADCGGGAVAALHENLIQSQTAASYLCPTDLTHFDTSAMINGSIPGNGSQFKVRHNSGAVQPDLLQCISSTCAKSSRLSLVNLLPSRLAHLNLFFFISTIFFCLNFGIFFTLSISYMYIVF